MKGSMANAIGLENSKQVRFHTKVYGVRESLAFFV
jgi:hypothetical protein